MRGELDASARESGERAVTRETLHPDLVASLAGSPRELAARVADVDLIRVAADTREADHATYNCSFETWAPLLETRETAPLSERAHRAQLPDLARIARALADLHAHGVVHGDLQPAFLGWAKATADSAPALTMIIGPNGPPAAHLRARILHGSESLAAIAYIAPEIAHGAAAATAASDVFALAAMTFEAITGLQPLGQLDGWSANDPRSRDPLILALRQALSDQPARRPSAVQLATALELASTNANVPASAPILPAAAPSFSPSASPSSGPAMSPAQRAALQADRAQMSSILIVLLIIGGAFVFFGACWLVTVNWSALGELGHFVLLALLTCGAAGVGSLLERRAYPGTGLTLILLASRLLWADAAYVLDISDRHGSPPWALAALLVTLSTIALLLLRRQSLVAWMAAFDFAIAAACIADALSDQGGAVGISLYCGAVAVALVVIAAALHRMPSKDDLSLGVPFSSLAALCALASAAAALFDDHGRPHGVFATAWPYVIGASASALWFALRRAYALYKWSAAAVALVILLFVPGIEAVVDLDSSIYRGVTVAIGFGLLSTMIRLPTNDFRDTALTLVGLANVVTCSTGVMFYRCADLPFTEILAGHRVVEMGLWVFGAVGLLVMGAIASGREIGKPTYQLIESVGLLQFFGAATILSLVREPEVAYPAVILVLATLLLGLGVVTRRTTWVIAAAVALLTNLWIQYFVRLNHLMPTALLILGFGVGLLVLGFAYERRIKQLLPQMRTWR